MNIALIIISLLLLVIHPLLAQTADLVVLKTGVRWLDGNIGQFGSTFNLTFVNADIFTSRWQVRFRFAMNGTVIKEYWGSWTLVQLPHNWYQLVPHTDLRLDPFSNVYFSFNGDWDGTAGQASPQVLGIDAAEIQIAPSSGTESPSVAKLEPGIGFMNVAFGADVTNAPFGNFIRSQKESEKPRAQPGGYKPPPPGPTNNWLGFYICQPIFVLALAMFGVATFGRWRYRQHFRKQCQEREWIRKSADNNPTAPTNMEGGQMKGEGGALAEVYTHYAREQHRHSILQPGLAYRMSVYQAAAQDGESLRAGMKSPPMPDLPRYGTPRVASPSPLRSGTPHYGGMPRAPSPALHEQHYNDDEGDMGITGRMNYNDGR